MSFGKDNSIDNLVGNADSICQIVKRCSEHGVRLLRFGALYLEFNSANQVVKEPLAVQTRLSENESKRIQDEELASEAELADDFERENLRLTNPSAFEFFEAGELIEGRTS